MITERMLRLLIFDKIFEVYEKDTEYMQFLSENYNVDRLYTDYKELGKEFLKEYALK